MNLTQLNVFREVMQSASISQAARQLGRTQPAVSLAIKNLEDSLGIKLFERVGRQLVPVPEAAYLLTEATEILARLATVSATMKSLSNAESGSLNVAAMPGPSTYLFPRYVSRALGTNSDIRISLSSRSSLQIHELAGTQSIDFGFADMAPRQRTEPQYLEEVISANCFCAVPRDHVLAEQPTVSCRDLDGLPMGALQNNHVMVRRIRETFQRENAVFNKVVDSQITLPLLQFVSAGQCLAIVDPLTVASEEKTGVNKQTIAFRPFTAGVRYDYAILYPRHRPLSRLATRIRNGWKDEVIQLLEGIGADPRVGPAPE